MNDTAVAGLLDEVLRDAWIVEVQLSDMWRIRFSNDLWLSAYELAFSEERSLRTLLSSTAPVLLGGIDADNVPKMTCLCALMRESIRRCHVDESSVLRIVFERGGEMHAMTNVPVVDWMWSIGPEPGDPYRTPCIAYCLSYRGVDVGSLRPLNAGRHQA